MYWEGIPELDRKQQTALRAANCILYVFLSGQQDWPFKMLIERTKLKWYLLELAFGFFATFAGLALRFFSSFFTAFVHWVHSISVFFYVLLVVRFLKTRHYACDLWLVFRDLNKVFRENQSKTFQHHLLWFRACDEHFEWSILLTTKEDI